MRKKIISILLCLCLAAGLAACGSDSTDSSGEGGSKGFVGITVSMYTNEGLTLLCDTIKERL